MKRRTFLTAATCGLVSLAAPALSKGALKLPLYRPKTSETVTAEFFEDEIGDIAYQKLNWLLRDIASGRWSAMDPSLLVLAAKLADDLGAEHLVVLSGYRTEATNRSIRGAAKNSYHVRAQAVDLRAPGIPTLHIARSAAKAGFGGVGRYPARGFVHLDTGPRRRWRRR